MGKHHDKSYPNETVEYRAARDELLSAEIELRQHIENVASLRRRLPNGGAVSEDYVFDEVSLDSDVISKVKFPELFDDGKDTLIVYGFMYGPDWDAPCPSCTSITDSTNGIARHVRERINLVTIAKAPAEKLKELANGRNWNGIRLLSSFNSDFNEHYFAETDGEPNQHNPMLNVFVRRGDVIHHFWGSETFFTPIEGGHPRHVDSIWPLWNFFDMTPEGRGDFMPKLDY